MSKNENLHAAKVAKNDEFYTQLEDIEKEMNAYISYDRNVFKDKVVLCPCDDPEWSAFTKYFVANFERLGLKKFISTSYAQGAANKQISLFESGSDNFDEVKHENHGRIFVIDRSNFIGKDMNKLVPDDLSWGYLEGDGDFRSEEVTKLRDEADFVITNPPFSLFREVINWIFEKENLKFVILGNQNAITYKEIFPYIKNNKLWLGASIHSGGVDFQMPDNLPTYSKNVFIKHGKHFINLAGIRWFTNIDFHKRHENYDYMTMEENLRFNDKLKKKFLKDYGKLEYPHYDNYDAIEVPFSNAIPSDYTEEKEVTAEELQKLVAQGFKIEILSSAKEISEAKIPVEVLDRVSVSVETATDRQTDRQKG